MGMETSSSLGDPKAKTPLLKHKLRSAEKGFTLFEITVVVGIIAIFVIAIYPNIINSLETRSFENTARDIQTTLQRAKFQAVKTKLNHRVKFDFVNNEEVFYIESQDVNGVWNLMDGFMKKTIPSRFNVTVDVPNQIVEFSPLGTITNFDALRNTITLTSIKLESMNQPDERVISVFRGGSIQYKKQ